jgi:hypothetical protein
MVAGRAGRDSRFALEWKLTDSSGALAAHGKADVRGVAAGAVSEIAVLNIDLPRTEIPVELTLRVTLSDIHNEWRLWAVPRLSPSPDRALGGQERGAGGEVVSELTDDVLARVRAGGFALLWQTRPDAGFTRSLPFWREAIHVLEPHPLWARAPHAGYADMRFFSVASDLAFDRAALQSVLGVEIIPIWRRFDARQMTWAEYLAEARLGAGRLFVTTLRFAGGLGYQPASLEANPWGTWLVASLLEAGGLEK